MGIQLKRTELCKSFMTILEKYEYFSALVKICHVTWGGGGGGGRHKRDEEAERAINFSDPLSCLPLQWCK